MKKTLLGNETTTLGMKIDLTAEFRTRPGYLATIPADANGNTLTETDPVGNTTTYTYDSVNNKVTTVPRSVGSCYQKCI